MTNPRELLTACQDSVTRLLEVEAKATPGPWSYDLDEIGCRDIRCDEYGVVTTHGLGGDTGDEEDAANASFICTARNLHRPMLEYLRERLIQVGSIYTLDEKFTVTRAAKMDADEDLHDIARILAHDDPAIKQMLGGSDE